MTDRDDRPLPAQTRRDLDRAAAVVGQRTATTAHPDCTCVEPVERETIAGDVIVLHIVTGPGQARCPLHGPTR